MGAYASLKVGKYEFLDCVKFVDVYTLLIFNMRDKKIEKVLDEDGLEDTRYIYQTTAKKAIQCLNVLGYTSSKLKETFEDYKNELMWKFEFYFQDFYEEALERFSFENWSAEVLKVSKSLIANGINFDSLRESINRINKDTNVCNFFIIKSLTDWHELFFGMPYEMDPWYTMRIIFESLPETTEIILDYTEFVDSGYYDPEYVFESFSPQKIIIMTEGKSDSKVISQSLELLYPHLRQYYFFMDFDISNAHGSTNFLTHYIKAFIGAGIESRIIALYDNDAAAQNEILNFEGIEIPPNIRILHLPEIELANDYPTIGPFSNQTANINGLACSIELFLGDDILRNDNGDLVPVIWKGFIDRINAYQGEIAHKHIVQQRFFELLDQIQEGLVSLEDHDWTAMKKLLNMIFDAFN